LARHNRRPGVAAAQQPVAKVEPQRSARFLRPAGMTFVAVLHQRRPDALLEEFDAGIISRSINSGTASGCDQHGHREQASQRWHPSCNWGY
jgi:hypothetical protein